MNVKERLDHFEKLLAGTGCKLLPVSKTHPESKILEAYQSGMKRFGENKVQELVAKAENLPRDVEWHLIGHLQSNKVKYIAPFITLIHSVDSLKLLKEIDKQAAKNNRVISCLLQVHIASEETKFGFDPSEVKQILESPEFQKLENVKIVGLMGMATNTENMTLVRKEFAGLKSLFEELKKSLKSKQIDFQELSMGMSNDFQIAVEEGSTMVRIGSAIFGSR